MSQPPITMYNPVTGRIINIYDAYASGQTELLTSKSIPFILTDEKPSFLNQYVTSGGQLALLQEMELTANTDTILANGSDTWSATGLPANTTVLVDNVEVGVFSGQFTMSVGQDGDYHVRLQARGFRDEIFILHAV